MVVASDEGRGFSARSLDECKHTGVGRGIGWRSSGVGFVDGYRARVMGGQSVVETCHGVGKGSGGAGREAGRE